MTETGVILETGQSLLLGGAGTQHFGGVRPGCWVNAIPAGGLVLMPDFTEKCTCSYDNKACVALESVEEIGSGSPGAGQVGSEAPGAGR